MQKIKTSKSESINNSLDGIRAIAASLVLFYHFAIFFFTEQTYCAKLSGTKSIDLSASSWAKIWDKLPLDLGSIAVSFFFLLSGYLLPSLVKRYPSRLAFLKNRVLRLWPVYSVGLICNLILIYVSHLWSEIGFSHTFGSILASLVGVRDILGYPFLTGVVWTFEVERNFIFFCALIYPILKNLTPLKVISVWGLLLGSFISSQFLLDIDLPIASFPLLTMVALKSRYIVFIFIGTVVFLYHQKNLSFWKALSLIGLGLIIFCGESWMIIKPHKVMKILLSYTLGLSLFLFMIKMKKLSHPWLTKIAAISYPLYLIHAVPGYILAYGLIALNIPLPLSFLIATITAGVSAWMIHRWIEQPFHKYARKSAVNL